MTTHCNLIKWIKYERIKSLKKNFSRADWSSPYNLWLDIILFEKIKTFIWKKIICCLFVVRNIINKDQFLSNLSHDVMIIFFVLSEDKSPSKRIKKKINYIFMFILVLVMKKKIQLANRLHLKVMIGF